MISILAVYSRSTIHRFSFTTMDPDLILDPSKRLNSSYIYIVLQIIKMIFSLGNVIFRRARIILVLTKLMIFPIRIKLEKCKINYINELVNYCYVCEHRISCFYLASKYSDLSTQEKGKPVIMYLNVLDIRERIPFIGYRERVGATRRLQVRYLGRSCETLFRAVVVHWP